MNNLSNSMDKISDEVESKFKRTIKKYKLLEKSEKIIVAASGGKDSSVALYLLHKLGYEVEALYINLRLGHYSDRCEASVRELCSRQGIKMHILDINEEFGMRMCNIRQGVQSCLKVSNCMVCGVVKKWLLNKEARRLKMDKIVTGHHLDDESQTIIMNFLQGNLMLGANSGPMTGSLEDKKFVPRVKPLYFIAEEDIKEYAKLKGLEVVYEKCPCAASSLRIRTREFLSKLDEKTNQRIVGNFLEILPRLKKQLHKQKIIYCKSCGEPSRNEVCKKCELLNLGHAKR
jgi:uncharacterized protein (TIGR00269 family)